jgi:hypothetical protein
MDKENVDIRFGMVAVQKGFIKKEDILKALDIQLAEDFSVGRHRLIGKILLDEGLLSLSQVGAVLETLAKVKNPDPK